MDKIWQYKFGHTFGIANYTAIAIIHVPQDSFPESGNNNQ